VTNLAPYNTFKVEAFARDFIELSDLSSLSNLGNLENSLILGLGANILFTKNFESLVIKNNLKGKKVLKETDEEVLIEVASGENWHEFVMWSVENSWSGVENLALIPGTVGGAAVGNIGAYGQTVGEIIEKVKTDNGLGLTNQECQFSYRDSIFKRQLKNKAFITSVVFKLYKTAHFAADYYSRYESLRTYLPSHPTPQTVAEAVTKIRTAKLPDWKTLPTAGSVFKNPFVTKKHYEALAKEIKDLQMYPVDKMIYPRPGDPVFNTAEMVKIPAGRLLDELGWRGKRIGRVATYDKHALVVVNCGGASGQEIFDFVQQMRLSVKKAYAINLEPEIEII
jgi:UDP-N-acetylmuramate dehydrogenase